MLGNGRPENNVITIASENLRSRGRRERLTTPINSTRRITCIVWCAAFFVSRFAVAPRVRRLEF